MARQKRGKQLQPSAPTPRASETILRFTPDHLWVRSQDGHARLGLSDHGQHDLGEIIALELPDVGEALERGAVFGELESVRTVLELTAPVSGRVTAVNADLEDYPASVNEDPYHEGWLIEITLQNESELEKLLTPDDYEDSV